MKENQRHPQEMFPAHHEAAVILESEEGAFEAPAFARASRRPAVLRTWLLAIELMAYNQFYDSLLQAQA